MYYKNVDVAKQSLIGRRQHPIWHFACISSSHLSVLHCI